MREVVRGDKHNLRKSANCKAQISTMCGVNASWHWFVRCDLQIFSGCVCHLEQLHAQSPFLFPIVFSINFYFIQLFSFSSDKDRRTDSRIRRKKHSAAPPGIEPRILRILVARSNHWATKPQRELRVNFRLSPSCQIIFFTISILFLVYFTINSVLFFFSL